jgi:hypothetical protein
VKARLEATKKPAGEKEIAAALNDEEKSEHTKLTGEIDTLKKQKRAFTLGLLMSDAEGQPPLTKVLFQGDYKQEKNPVEPGFISALDPNPAAIHKAPNTHSTHRRFTLAEWIVSPQNPLTSRVLVNRVWQSHFGRGIVATPNDFGLAGARPTHPELLDWLATELVRDGWSLKKLHRLIVTSATYRQSSTLPKKDSLRGAKLDAENHLLWRQNLRRLSAEELRDSLLAIGGSLHERDGGPAVWPKLPQNLLLANPALLDDNQEKTKGWYPTATGDRDVRSIFLIQKRTVKVPFMETFDLPENATSCPRRNQSIVAPQALTLLNSDLVTEQSRAMAARVEQEAGKETGAQIDRACALAIQRPPTAGEKRSCAALLKNRSLPELCRALLNLNEFIYVD